MSKLFRLRYHIFIDIASQVLKKFDKCGYTYICGDEGLKESQRGEIGSEV